MSAWVAYALGVLTVPAAMVAWWGFWSALDRNHGIECAVGDWSVDTQQRGRLWLNITFWWHMQTTGRRRWHREAVKAEAAKWGR